MDFLRGCVFHNPSQASCSDMQLGGVIKLGLLSDEHEEGLTALAPNSLNNSCTDEAHGLFPVCSGRAGKEWDHSGFWSRAMM